MFGSTEYKNFLNINFFVHPFKTDSDDDGLDDNYPDNDKNKLWPWPTYQHDRFRGEQGHRQTAKEHRKAVEQWSSMVLRGVSGA